MDRLTDVEFWDTEYWSGERPERLWLYRDFDYETVQLLRHAAGPGPARVLEVGAGGSRVLPYLAKRFRYRVFGSDYSPTGCRLLRANFGLTGVGGAVVREDMFQSSLAPGSFDLVYSSGLIEHFEDTRKAIEAHLDLVRPGGMLVLIVPNFLGLQGRVCRRLAPPRFAKHNVFGPGELHGMLRDLSLTDIRSGYLGSFLFHIERGKDWTGVRRLPAPLQFAATNAARLANGAISFGFRLSPWRPHSRLLSPAFFAVGAKDPAGQNARRARRAEPDAPPA